MLKSPFLGDFSFLFKNFSYICINTKRDRKMKRVHINFREESFEGGVEVFVDIFIDGVLRVEDFDMFSYIHWSELLDSRCLVFTTLDEFKESPKSPDIYYILPNPYQHFFVIEKGGERIVDKLKISQKELWEKLFNKKVMLTWS